MTSLAFGSFISYLTLSSVNNSYNPRDWNFNVKTCIGLVSGFLNGLFLLASLIAVTKYNLEFIKNNPILGKIVLGSSLLIVPVIFIWSLKQEMSCDWAIVFKTPATLEVILSGIIMGYNLPKFLFLGIPKAFKLYKEGFLENIKNSVSKKPWKRIRKYCKIILRKKRRNGLMK